MPEFLGRREAMVASLRRRGFINDEKVERAMLKVERHLFVPEDQVFDAYRDTPLHIGQGQTISAPHMVAMMLELLDLEEGQKVLEVGTGSGYNAALVAEMVGAGGEVHSIERIGELATTARKRLAKAGYGRVNVVVGDGSKGLAEKAPFDRIMVTAAGPRVPEALRSQLRDGGIMLIPVGSMAMQDLVKVLRKGDRFEERRMGGVMFVPLIGEQAHRE